MVIEKSNGGNITEEIKSQNGIWYGEQQEDGLNVD